jgi:hypothetical protein
MPMQWAGYQPSWDIAATVLRNKSVVGDPGTVNGLEVAVEPRPLLEALLACVLWTFAHASSGGYEFVAKQEYSVLTHEDGAGSGRTVPDRSVEPDGLLVRSSLPAISFEAKYTAIASPPEREHVFQAR